MSRHSRLAYFEYGSAILAVAAATLVRLPLERFLHGRAPYALYYVPILLMAWHGGVGPTLVAIVLSLASAWAFVVPGSEPGYNATVAIFLVVSATMVFMARTARRMQEAGADLASIVESSNDAIITKDLQGIILSSNAAAERLFGYGARELIGRPASALIPQDHEDEEPQILERLRRGERLDHFETVRVTKRGRRVDVSLTISPIRDRYGAIVGASSIARDISERKRAAEALAAQREWLDRTLESIGDAVIATDSAGRVVFMNPVAESLTGWRSSDARGKDCAEVFRIVNEATRQTVESPVHRVLREGRVVGLANSTVLLAADGKERPIDDSGAPIRGRDGEITGVVLVFRDISERRRVEAERSAAMTERERLLEAERAARSEAERASRSKDEFVAMVSHELRTPLSAIVGWTQLLKRSRNVDAEMVQRGVDVIDRNARAQEHLISDLLDMSRIISGKFRLDVLDVDLVALIRAAIETTKPAADAKGIVVESTLDPSAAATTGDPSRLQQCIWNLLSNAIKFTPEGGRVAVTLRRSNSHVEIGVSDDGIGIRPDFLPFVFDPFRQGDASASRRFGGLGLGLSIVKQLVELHGGQVRVDSRGEGQGATFTLTLPTRESNAGVAPAPAQPERRAFLDQLKVLLVEDDGDNREMLRALLEQHRAQVFAAASAAEAFEMLATVRPGILVSDIALPEIDGYELIRRVRQRDSGCGGRIPAIALTALATAEDRTKALRAGYQAHIAKPADPDELLATIASLADLVLREQEHQRRGARAAV